jgi:hypothetical protein
VAFRKDKRGNRTFKRTPVWMRSEEPQQIWDGGVRELNYLLGSLRLISGTRKLHEEEHPLAGKDLTYEERCAVGAADAFAWLVERGLYGDDAVRLAAESQALADALSDQDFEAVVANCNIIVADLESVRQNH